MVRNMKYPKGIDKKKWDIMVYYTRSFMYLIGSLVLGYVVIRYLR